MKSFDANGEGPNFMVLIVDDVVVKEALCPKNGLFTNGLCKRQFDTRDILLMVGLSLIVGLRSRNMTCSVSITDYSVLYL